MAIEIICDKSKSFSYIQKAFIETLKEFCDVNRIKSLIAISGGADNQEEAVTAVVSDFLTSLKDAQIGILSGGTKGGVPEIATKLAREFSFPTVGVFPTDGRKYALLDKLDFAIETLPTLNGKTGFGTETPTFIAIAGGMTVIGGEFGTLAEVALALKCNKSRIRRGEELIYLCPIKGLGGVAELIDTLPGIWQFSSALPETSIYNGHAAAHFFKDKLSLG